MKIIHLFLLPLLWLSACADRAACWAEFPADAPEIGYVGRTAGDGGGVSFDWAGTTVRCRFTGSRLAVRGSDT
ncbi:MAG: GDSL family lipase, partial [Alistipes sp.]|nr:GDSL family lipase [Alistipes sp.]